jgi:hypothetical protein
MLLLNESGPVAYVMFAEPNHDTFLPGDAVGVFGRREGKHLRVHVTVGAVLMQLLALALAQNLWFVNFLMVAIPESAELAIFPSSTIMTVTPRVCAASSASATAPMLSEKIVPRVVEPAGAALISRSNSVWMV